VVDITLIGAEGPEGPEEATFLALVDSGAERQAKGREWEIVGVRLTREEQQHLQNGLDERVEAERQVYVALTRAKDLTVAV
jgi:DNA helicase-2/ATP-dependent DNA helicase PcrA